MKAQGIHDDEEQRLLNDLRLKPLSVEHPEPPQSSLSIANRRKAIIVASILLVILLGAVGAVVYLGVNQGSLTTRNTDKLHDSTGTSYAEKNEMRNLGKDGDDSKDMVSNSKPNTTSKNKKTNEITEEPKEHKTQDKKRTADKDGSDRESEDYDYAPQQDNDPKSSPKKAKGVKGEKNAQKAKNTKQDSKETP